MCLYGFIAAIDYYTRQNLSVIVDISLYSIKLFSSGGITSSETDYCVEHVREYTLLNGSFIREYLGSTADAINADNSTSLCKSRLSISIGDFFVSMISWYLC